MSHPTSESSSAASIAVKGNGFTAVIPLIIGVALAFALHTFLPSMINRYYQKVVLDIGVAIILAVSLNIVNGMTGQFSIGHAGFMTLGGYAAAGLTYYSSLLIWGDHVHHGGFFGAGECLFVGACVFGGIVAAIAGFVVGLPSLRLRGDYLAIVTLGFGEIIRVILQQTNKRIESAEALKAATWKELVPPPVGGSLGFDGIPVYTNLFWVYTMLAVTLIVAYRLKSSSLGRSMISVREDEIAAQAMGVNISQQKVKAFVIAAFFAGVGGGLYAHESGAVIGPKDAGFQKSFDYVIMAVLGGRGSISGVTIAAIVLTALPEFLRDFDQYRLIVYAAMLIVMMLVRPQGLMGIHEIWNIWHKPSKTSGTAEDQR